MINFYDLRENQTYIMLGFALIDRSDIVCKRLGSLHFIPLASKQYVARMGLPTRHNLEDHLFLQSHFYEAETPIWADWQRACARGRIAHFCDDTFAYGLLAKMGLGIALLGTYVVSEACRRSAGSRLHHRIAPLRSRLGRAVELATGEDHLRLALRCLRRSQSLVAK